MANTYCAVESNICGASVWDLLDVPLLGLRILGFILYLGEGGILCTSLLNSGICVFISLLDFGVVSAE